MDTAITVNSILVALGIVVAIAGGISAIVTLWKYATGAHDRVQKWDEYDKQIKDIKEEQEVLTACMVGVLDGLHQLKCNGKVTETSNMLSEYLVKKAHK